MPRKVASFVDDNERKRAVGTIDSLPPLTRALLSESLSAAGGQEEDNGAPWFLPLDKPRSGDWLSSQKETPQGFDLFCRKTMVSQPHGRFKKLLLVPIGTFPPAVLDVKMIARIAAAFFDCPVILAKPLSVKQLIANSTKTTSRKPGEPFHRIGGEGQDQLHASLLLDELSRMKTSNRTYSGECWAVMGLTLIDLFPRAEWNFVYGLGRADDGSGIFSFARYKDDGVWPTLADASNPADEFAPCEIQPGELSDDTSLPDDEVAAAAGQVAASAPPVPPASVLAPQLTGFMRASARVMCHETCHLLGISHCVHYSCLMNGSMHELEANRRPLRLCPVCLRKLAQALQPGSVGLPATSRSRVAAASTAVKTALPGGGGAGRTTRTSTRMAEGPRDGAGLIVRRYVRMHLLFKAVGMVEEAEWIAARLAAVNAATTTQSAPAKREEGEEQSAAG